MSHTFVHLQAESWLALLTSGYQLFEIFKKYQKYNLILIMERSSEVIQANISQNEPLLPQP